MLAEYLLNEYAKYLAGHKWLKSSEELFLFGAIYYSQAIL
jgi:hypothetical protein